MLGQVTPVILTYNEAPNIERTLEALRWARDIVVVDSFSDDETLQLAARFPNVRIFQRRFDRHAEQWNFAIGQTGIASEWTLALDADYVVTPDLVEEIRGLKPDPQTVGYRTSFIYCVLGSRLRGTLYPPVVTLFRTGKGRYENDGHTQRLRVDGPLQRLRNPMLHDDRKPLSRWFSSQIGYSALEASKLVSRRASSLSAADAIRKWVFLAPGLVFLYSLFVKGTVLDGRAGLYYSLQRLVAELMLSVFLMDAYLRSRQAPSTAALGKENVDSNYEQ